MGAKKENRWHSLGFLVIKIIFSKKVPFPLSGSGVNWYPKFCSAALPMTCCQCSPRGSLRNILAGRTLAFCYAKANICTLRAPSFCRWRRSRLPPCFQKLQPREVGVFENDFVLCFWWRLIKKVEPEKHCSRYIVLPRAPMYRFGLNHCFLRIILRCKQHFAEKGLSQ